MQQRNSACCNVSPGRYRNGVQRVENSPQAADAGHSAGLHLCRRLPDNSNFAWTCRIPHPDTADIHSVGAGQEGYIPAGMFRTLSARPREGHGSSPVHRAGESRAKPWILLAGRPLWPQPLTPVKLIPSMKVRWARKNTTTMGSVNIVAAAISRPHSAPCCVK